VRLVATRIAVGVLAIVAVVVGTPGPAAASDPYYWQNNPTLCQSGCTTQRNLIRFWQAILWADNIGGGISSESFADGRFGPNTHAKTKIWQDYDGHRDWGGALLSVDGRVGPRTWWSANHNNQIVCDWIGPPSDVSGNRCRYNGLSGDRYFHFHVSDNGNWWFWLWDGGTFWDIRRNCQTGTCIEG